MMTLEKTMMFDDVYWMYQAIELAKEAAVSGEVPVGAIVVLDNKIIGTGFNKPISSCDPTAHAEIVALRDAAKNTNNYRLIESCLYVTLEPCTMCAGAIIHSRIKRLIYGADEPKAGAVKSQASLFTAPYLNHKVDVVAGVCSEECSQIISAFFSKRREKIKNKSR